MLARIARDYLAIQGTSVASERTFSSSGLTDSNRRRQLTSENFAAIQMAKASLKRKQAREKREREEADKKQKAKWDAELKEDRLRRADEANVHIIIDN